MTKIFDLSGGRTDELSKRSKDTQYLLGQIGVTNNKSR